MWDAYCDWNFQRVEEEGVYSYRKIPRQRRCGYILELHIVINEVKLEWCEVRTIELHMS